MVGNSLGLNKVKRKMKKLITAGVAVAGLVVLSAFSYSPDIPEQASPLEPSAAGVVAGEGTTTEQPKETAPKSIPVSIPKPKPQSNCDSNYSGCVPVASDVDCAGGSGNGPAYTSGPVRVIGSDIYDLDRDGDGWGCE